MKGTYSALMQSKFFNPAFNSAIFDGPLRIYFSQSFEPMALKLYFALQQRHSAELARAKELHKFLDRTVLLMLYPSSENFRNAFVSDAFLGKDQLSDDTILGVNGAFDESKLDQVLAEILHAFQDWEKISFENEKSDAIL